MGRIVGAARGRRVKAASVPCVTSAPLTPPVPPRAPVRPHVHREHGVERPDSYAWMRDLSDPALLAYLQDERAFYEDGIAHLDELRSTLGGEMRSRVPQDETGAPWVSAGWEYRWERRGTAEHARLVRRRAGSPEAAPDASWQVLLDLDPLAGPGGHVELGVCDVSPSGTLLAYSLDTTGDERFDLRVRDLASGHDLPSVVTGVHHGGAWAADSATYFVVVPDAAWRPAEVRRYRVADQSGPAAEVGSSVVGEPDEAFTLSVHLTRSRQVVVITASSSDCSEAWVLPADDPAAVPRSVAGRRPGIEYSVDHRPDPTGSGRGELFVVTNDGAPEFQLVRGLLDAVGPEEWQPLLRPAAGERVLRADAFAGHVVVSMRRDGVPVLRVVPLDGAATWDVEAGAAAGLVLAGRQDLDSSAIRVHTEQTVLPRETQDVDLRSGQRVLVHREDVPGHDPDAYRTERRWLAARDGVRVPVLLARHRDVPLDGSAPCVIYGYGAYEAIDDPWFDTATVCLLDRGVVFVHAHVRGGGEVGRAWWEQGRLTAKPTSWHDLVDVADALADPAAPAVDGTRVAIRGISAGGLLVAGAMQERPDRFAAVVAEVPFVDVVTSMLDETLPLTTLEWTEWGDPRDPEGFADLLRWSPYDNTGLAQRPRLLVTGALHDTRVRVTEPAKWVARMRDLDAEAGHDPARLLLRAETGEGAHAGPTGRFARLDYEAEIAAWLLDALRCVGE
jgi:oligopeptidase B